MTTNLRSIVTSKNAITLLLKEVLFRRFDLTYLRGRIDQQIS
jgi:hypothetical protein